MPARSVERRRSSMTPLRVWIFFSALVLGVSIGTGYRASRAALEPQYLLTKTSVLVEVPYVPADETEARLEATMADAGAALKTVREERPMFVLGLADAAVPAIILTGLPAWIW